MNMVFVTAKHVIYPLAVICRLNLPEKLIICFLLVSLSGKPAEKTTISFPSPCEFVQLTSSKISSDTNADRNIYRRLNSESDSLSCYVFYINELNEEYEYIEKQESLISRQKSHFLILLFLFFIMTFLFLFSIVFFRYRIEKLAALYKEHCQLSVSKGLTYYQNNNKRLAPSGEQEKFKRIYNGVLRLFDKEKIYLEPGLTIRDIAQRLFTNEKYVSKAINLGAGINFSNFLNKYRVNEAIKYLHTPLYDPLSLEQIMEKSGFYSRSTFTSAFKNSTGISPGQYRNRSPGTQIIELPASAG